MTHHPLSAYADSQRRQVRGRQAEALAFSDAARRQQAVLDRPGDKRALEEVLRFNQRLWTVMQVEMSDSSNPLPASLKTDILNLAAFVDRESVKPAGRNLEILVEINRNVAARLMSSSPTTGFH